MNNKPEWHVLLGYRHMGNGVSWKRHVFSNEEDQTNFAKQVQEDPKKFEHRLTGRSPFKMILKQVTIQNSIYF